eukprot:CAMPEP_0115012724 /NCGR_PEP_ID=MMETSP0216-20121206/24926_1 /TAXON_ID=223996 /ORGANISM="Protocruzia adherens, Strain Boccale" /LENGTH=114 /DNA_ID=CAMNT_0002381873 /DNA_START=18 /DNA_END=358 /DNA_ORIENTATION=+
MIIVPTVLGLVALDGDLELKFQITPPGGWVGYVVSPGNEPDSFVVGGIGNGVSPGSLVPAVATFNSSGQVQLAQYYEISSTPSINGVNVTSEGIQLCVFSLDTMWSLMVDPKDL